MADVTHFKKLEKSSDMELQPGQRQRPLTNKVLLPSGALLATRVSQDVCGTDGDGGLQKEPLTLYPSRLSSEEGCVGLSLPGGRR